MFVFVALARDGFFFTRVQYALRQVVHFGICSKKRWSDGRRMDHHFFPIHFMIWENVLENRDAILVISAATIFLDKVLENSVEYYLQRHIFDEVLENSTEYNCSKNLCSVPRHLACLIMLEK